ncbi:Sarcosine/dimethylglycine N-methyltransferase [Streptomyces rimosus subsp. rimosus]|nr:Sarcosine/dimethylglycine N-methyltransferase [Streptomyces rimosus subsp. rimosus]UTJ11746.1 Sarcosine/dimethylglycine N-methyltransferase [Streptomyces rimosus subsp. rimosus]
MRVLDLGSGRGATSVFLAREYGVEVVAADWWIAAEEAAAVFAEAGVGDRVEAVRAKAHALPFEAESFDAIVSVDAFEYFGTADSYLPYLMRFLRPGGQLGFATPAMIREVRETGRDADRLARLAAGPAPAPSTGRTTRPTGRWSACSPRTAAMEAIDPYGTDRTAPPEMIGS